MNKLSFPKRLLIKIIIFFGQNTMMGRGFSRNKLIRIIHRIINYDTANDPIESRIQTIVDKVPFYFYFDHLSETKHVMGSYDKKEINFIQNKIRTNDVFIDIGANIGFYTQNIASIYDKNKFSKIISIEPNPLLCERIKDNLSLLAKKNPEIRDKVVIENYAIGNESYDTYLSLAKGYGNASITHESKPTSIKVQMTPLINLIKKNNIESIKILKIDIEGYEDIALIPFFKNVEATLFPQNIIIEHGSRQLWRQDVIKFLFSMGYKELFKTRSNIILSNK